MINKIFKGFQAMYVYYIFFFAIFFHFLFLLSRIIFERLPVDFIWLTGVFVCFFLFLKLSRFFFLRILVIYFTLFERIKEENKPKTSLIVKVTDKILDFDSYFFRNFFQGYLLPKAFFSKLSLVFFKFYLHFMKSSVKFNLIFVILPWTIGLLFFFKEILFEEQFYITLYVLSFNVLLRRILKTGLFFARFEAFFLYNKVFEKNFPNFNCDSLTRGFFIFNSSIRNHFLFREQKKLSNKKNLKNLWLIFSEMMFLNLTNQSLLYLQDDLKAIIPLTLKINFIIYFSSFSLLLLNQSLIIHDWVFVLFISVSCFSIFLLFLNFLERDPEIEKGNMFSLNTYCKIEIIMNRWFELTKKELLETNSFLKNSDLIYPFEIKESVESLHAKRYKEYEEKFSIKDRQYIDTVSEFIFSHWYLVNVENDNIDFEIMDLKQDFKPLKRRT